MWPCCVSTRMNQRNPTCWCSSLLRLRANWSWVSSSISTAGGARWTGCEGVNERGNQYLAIKSGNNVWTILTVQYCMQFYRCPKKSKGVKPFGNTTLEEVRVFDISISC